MSGDKWYPLDEQESARIEEEHRKPQWRTKARGGGGGQGAVFACILVAGMLTNDCGITFDTAHVSLHLLLQLIMS